MNPSTYALSLLDSLAGARWHVAGQTFGNCHATLIGIVVDWWVSDRRNGHFALEGAPKANPQLQRTRSVGVCDALLCGACGPEGVVEVEGTRKDWAVEKVEQYLNDSNADLATLAFGLLVYYSTQPRGSGANRAVPSATDESILALVAKASSKHRDKVFLVVAAEKNYEPDAPGIRIRSPYYQSRLSRVHGWAYMNGQITGKRNLWQA